MSNKFFFSLQHGVSQLHLSYIFTISLSQKMKIKINILGLEAKKECSIMYLEHIAWACIRDFRDWKPIIDCKFKKKAKNIYLASSSMLSVLPRNINIWGKVSGRNRTNSTSILCYLSMFLPSRRGMTHPKHPSWSWFLVINIFFNIMIYVG